jgi:hypothetical protein
LVKEIKGAGRRLNVRKGRMNLKLLRQELEAKKLLLLEPWAGVDEML